MKTTPEENLIRQADEAIKLAHEALAHNARFMEVIDWESKTPEQAKAIRDSLLASREYFRDSLLWAERMRAGDFIGAQKLLDTWDDKPDVPPLN